MRVKYLLLDAYSSDFEWLVSGLVVEKASFAERQTPFFSFYIIICCSHIILWLYDNESEELLLWAKTLTRWSLP